MITMEVRRTSRNCCNDCRMKLRDWMIESKCLVEVGEEGKRLLGRPRDNSVLALFRIAR